MKRTILYIVIHCTATTQNIDIRSILDYWRYNLKWSNPGYHFIIDKSGNTIQLQDINKISNGVAGYNKNSIHIAYIGGIDSKIQPIDNRTDEQKKALKSKIKELKKAYPNAVICGHRDFKGVNKACPCFNAKEEYNNILVDK
ncbi:N-acetylmuramoyl-L-alanine amidase [Elizabethkingia meningoseptica]|uniref:N-acetylmuramoyl-L-alanine amidase n=1 Tax=Elizabethkingia meningoseptica TaxID=238 RepID=UPI0038921093